MTLAGRISALITSIGADIKALYGQSMPTGGSTNQLLNKSSGTNYATQWSGLSALLDTVFGSTRGAMLYRGASVWSILAPGTSGYALVSNGSGADPSYQAPLITTVAAASPGSTLTLTLGNEQVKYGRQTLTANLTITLASGSVGRHMVIPFMQAASGGPYTITWPGSGMNWRGGTAPTMPTTASALMLVTIYHDGTSYLATSTTF